jgi:glycyl-tRNA synthetase
MLIAREQRFDVRAGLDRAAAHLPIPASKEVIERCLAFIIGRLKGVLEADHRYDVVDAILAEQGWDPAGAARGVSSLEGWTARRDWAETLQAYARCLRITREQTVIREVDPGRLVEPAEKSLHQAIERAEASDRAPGSVDDFLDAFRPMIPAITRFFDDVLVMVDDEALRGNRLGLMQRVAGLARGVADLTRLEGF